MVAYEVYSLIQKALKCNLTFLIRFAYNNFKNYVFWEATFICWVPIWISNVDEICQNREYFVDVSVSDNNRTLIFIFHWMKIEHIH